MAAVATYTLPVYEAVVCGLTLTRLREEDSRQLHGVPIDLEERMIRTSIDLEVKMRTALETFNKGDFSRISKSDIAPIATALATLVSTIHGAEAAFRDSLSIISEAYRPAQSDVNAKIERANERLEEIAEAWCMAIDESSASQIREAIRAATKPDDDVKPWREVLASAKD
jgi:hypothetical protein